MAKFSADAVATVIAAGFVPYMRDAAKDSWLIFTTPEGDKIGNLQCGPFGRGFTRSTVHIANRTSGTGYRLDDDYNVVNVADLTHERLSECFDTAPSWAGNASRASVRKWSGIEAYKRDWFNATYRRVEVRYARAMARQRNAIGAFEEQIFACVIPVTSSHSETMDALIASINADHFEVQSIRDHSVKRDCA